MEEESDRDCYGIYKSDASKPNAFGVNHSDIGRDFGKWLD